MKELYRLLRIQGNLSTAYHPQTDGQTERMNRELERYLRTYVGYHQDDWAEWIAMAEFSYNDATHSATGFTPFYLNKGRHPRAHPDAPRYEGYVPAAEEFVQNLQKVRDSAKKALEKAKAHMKDRVDGKRRPAIAYADGDLVMVTAERLKSNRPSQKLDDKWRGPFKVLRKVGSAAYELEMPPKWKGYRIFNRDRLKRYVAPIFDSQRDAEVPPPPELVDEFEEYEVEAVLADRVRQGIKEFLIRWKGYPPENDTWEPQENLQNAKDALRRYMSRGRATRKGGHNVRIFQLNARQSDKRSRGHDDKASKRLCDANQEPASGITCESPTVDPHPIPKCERLFGLPRTRLAGDCATPPSRSANASPGLIPIRPHMIEAIRTSTPTIEVNLTPTLTVADSPTHTSGNLPDTEQRESTGAEPRHPADASDRNPNLLIGSVETPEDKIGAHDKNIRDAIGVTVAGVGHARLPGKERGKLVQRLLRHLSVVLRPHGFVDGDDSACTAADVDQAARRLRSMGLTVYIV
jgi:hypothetical protein